MIDRTDHFPAGDEDAIAAFYRALSAVQQVVKTQTADAGRYQYTYADLPDTLAEVKRVCADQNLTVTQNVSTDDGHLMVTTSLIHNPGTTDELSVLTFQPVGMRLPNDPQALGSITTYLRRYSLTAIFAIPVEDDDGRAASQQVALQREHDQSGGSGPAPRSVAERRIRESLGALEEPIRAEVMRRFRDTFGCGLSDLPVNRHGDALGFTVAEIPKVRADLEDQPDPQSRQEPHQP